MGFSALQMYGETTSYQANRKYFRYHLVMPSVPRRSPSTQDMVGGDNNRTPVIFQAPDIYRFVHQLSVPKISSGRSKMMATDSPIA